MLSLSFLSLCSGHMKCEPSIKPGCLSLNLARSSSSVVAVGAGACSPQRKISDNEIEIASPEFNSIKEAF